MLRNKPMEIKIKNLTPIWTGGVEGKCDRLHETGIIGSLRWWYEAVVRGLGGYACDPAEESCKFDTKSYKKSLSGDNTLDNALSVGLKEVCPACWLFGCTGWKRQFQLQIENAPITPLHFRTSIDMNKSWLRRIFGGESQNIDNLHVFFGDLRFRFLIRASNTDSTDYVRSQLLMLFLFISKYGGLGAKLQHGFGQVQILETGSATGDGVNDGLKALYRQINSGKFKFLKAAGSLDTPYNLQNFISLDYDLPIFYLKIFMQNSSHIGSNSKTLEDRYIPCAFDIRYKSKDKFGMRRWLKEEKNWSESDNPKQLGQIDQLLGPRSQWKAGKNTVKIEEDKRTASRLCIGMPYKIDDRSYRLRIFGFVPPALQIPEGELTPDLLSAYCQEYMQHAFNENIKPTNITSGKDIFEQMEANIL